MHNITYTYYPVGNITRISNSAGGADGLGGKFTYNYSYDELYRLETSSGGGNTDGDASYTLAMEYSPSGNILKKTLAATKQILGNSTYDSYSNEYTYSGAHALANVNDLQGGMPSLGFAFDGNGNMVMQQLYDANSGINERYLCWDEENRLSATRDNNYVTANIYDASGNRAWKIAGEMNWMWQNGSGWQGYGDLNLRTWYQGELMTITDVGFTKHYFIAGQRIASKLGESLSNSDMQPLRENHVAPLTKDYKVLNQGVADRMKRDFECLSLDYNNFTPGEPVIRVLDELVGVFDVNESNIFFYHSDHLGSSSFLTDGSGFATQHLQYLPFGEDLVHQQNTAAYYTPYTFSGKERDMETGLSYFGARYYDAGLSIWLSVDPMADKYPQFSSYHYCGLNPVMITDPDGADWYLDENDKPMYSKTIRSQEMMDKEGIKGKYIGLTGYSKDNKQYLSLLGEKFNTKNSDGSSNLKAEMVENLDNAIIDKYKTDFQNNRTDQYSSELRISSADMTVSKKITSSDVNLKRNRLSFNYGGGKVHYQMANDLSQSSLSWGDGKVRRVTGYFTDLGTGANATVERNNASFRVVNWIFPTTSDWEGTKGQVENLFKGRKW